MFVKICGLSTADDVRAAVEAGADAVGFVLTPSPRLITPALAAELAAAVPEGVLTVAVFRGEPMHVVRQAAAESGVRAVQLHGGESPADFAALRDLGLTLVRATSAGESDQLTTGSFGEDLLIVDSPEAGSGKTWDSNALRAGAPSGRWMLAGGLTPDNVAELVAPLSPWGVDVSSGLERQRGVKDPRLIRRFVQAVRAIS
ncbi:phosphoribosylanthranilate isomerase [Streptomyces violascens]|uniref:phosphoribosylanthranilate isomerase n=1 Tax=Streptomyces violascens TaxID=67381 RepID=UPI0036658B2A